MANTAEEILGFRIVATATGHLCQTVDGDGKVVGVSPARSRELTMYTALQQALVEKGVKESGSN